MCVCVYIIVCVYSISMRYTPSCKVKSARIYLVLCKSNVLYNVGCGMWEVPLAPLGRAPLFWLLSYRWFLCDGVPPVVALV